GDRAVDAVATRGLSLEVVLDRLPAPEVELLKVALREVGAPHGRVVDGSIGLRDLVVERALGPLRILSRWERTGRIAELDEHDEDSVGRLPGQLDVARLEAVAVAAGPAGRLMPTSVSVSVSATAGSSVSAGVGAEVDNRA